MLNRFLNLKLRTKLLIGFLTISSLLIVIGVSTYYSLSKLEDKKVEIDACESLKDGVTDVKFVVAHDLKLLMEIITTPTKSELDEFWKQHLVLKQEYSKAYQPLHMQLEERAWESEYKTRINQLRKQIRYVNDYREKILVPTIDQVYALRLRQLEVQAKGGGVALIGKLQNEIDALDNAADSKAELVFAKINASEKLMESISDSADQSQLNLSYSSKLQNIIMMIVGFVLAIFIAFLLSNYLVNNIHAIKDVIENLRHGILPNAVQVKSNDEIAEIAGSINHLTDGLRTTSEFAGEIGSGNFEKEFQPLSEQDVLGNALLNMRVNLIKVAEDEKKRNWATEGLAKFGDILRGNNEGIEALADNIISNLVKYLNANQGGIFVVNDTNQNDKHLELLACYAWNKKKYLHMRVDEGEGLVGQAWQENDTLYITDVPQNFVKITSGLGDANPKAFLIVPLTVNDETFGVIEIASFHLFEEYHIDFVNKLAESIASTLSTAKTNDRTKILLEQSQQQTEEMRAQEEEMRQNMEEMQATQEEMERKEGEMTRMMEQMQQQEEEMRQNMEEMLATQEEMERIQREMRAQNDIIDSIAIVSKTDVLGNITYVNDQFVKWAKYSREEVMGKNHRILRHEDMPAAAFEDMWKTISSGKIWRGEVKNKAKDGSVYWVDAVIAPVLDENGKPKEYIAQRFVINEQKEKQEQIQKVLEQSLAQEEEIRQNMEEMKATQEEMERVQREMLAQNHIIDSVAIVSKTDLLGNITYVNDQFVKWAKYSKEEVMGKNHRFLRHPDMPAAAFEDMWKTISSGNIWRGEVKNLAKDGSVYWVDAVIAPILDDNGKPKEYIAQRFVINEQKAQQEEMMQMLEETRAQEEEIRQNLEEMQAIQEDMERKQREMEAQNNIINSVAIVSKTDLQGNITYVNEEFEKWAKYSKNEVLGQNHRILRHPEMPDEAFDDMWKTISSGKIWRGEVLNKAKDGSEYWVDAIIAPVLDDSGKPKEYIAQRFVINEKKENEEKMKELMKRMDNKN